MTTSAASKCSHCGQPDHSGVCPTVKAIEYYENGMVKRVEYKTASDLEPYPAYQIPPVPQAIYPLPPQWPYATGWGSNLMDTPE